MFPLKVIRSDLVVPLPAAWTRTQNTIRDRNSRLNPRGLACCFQAGDSRLFKRKTLYQSGNPGQQRRLCLVSIHPVIFVFFTVGTGLAVSARADRVRHELLVAQRLWHRLQRNGQHLVDPLDGANGQMLLDVVGHLFQVGADLKNDNTLRVQVRDEGIGIPKHALPNLFQRFYRTQVAVERGIAGTGLGLYMVKQSVESYAGTITVASEEGRGTTFTVCLPTAER